MRRRAPTPAQSDTVADPRALVAGMHAFAISGPTERLDALVAQNVPGCSRSAAQRLIAEGRVTIDGRTVLKPSYRAAAGAVASVTVPEPRPSTLVPEAIPLSVVYEDADLLVVDKPAGMVVHPAAGHEAHTLVHGLLARCEDLSGVGGEQRPGIVHRLDRDTSGLLMVAKNDRAHTSLSRQLQARTVSKFYLALVRGAPRPASGIVDAPIARDPRDRKRMAIRDDGRPSRTRYHTVAAAEGYTFVAAGLETGRTHQIRVHLAALGCPIAGDPIYGAAGGPAGRLWLHSWRLAFSRPRDGQRIQLEAPLPPALTASWRSLSSASSARGDALESVLDRARGWAADGMSDTVAAEDNAAKATRCQHKERGR